MSATSEAAVADTPASGTAGFADAPHNPIAVDRSHASREAAKERRRQRILEAARELIRESGETGLSMRALADRAHVSTATPYNLFGSKHGVLTALLDADLHRYQRRLRRSDGDALDLMFDAVSVAREFFDREPEFYRAVMGAVYVAGADYRDLFSAPRRALWRWLVERAIADGCLPQRICTEAFAGNIVMIFFSAITDWISGQLSLAEMELRVHYGLALCLLAVAEPQHQQRLQTRLYEVQGRLEQYAAA